MAFKYTRALMRHPAVMSLLVLLSVSFILMPFSTLHMHVSADHHHVVFHGGHVHFHHADHDHQHAVAHVHDADDDPAADHDDDHDLQVDSSVDMHAGALGDSRIDISNWSSWGIVLGALVVWCFSLPYLTTVFRPPAYSASFRHHRHYWRPPSRGPPIVSI